MHVLVVEDEKKTHEYLKKGLMENGFVVDVAVNGEDGLHLALTGDYDLIILDPPSFTRNRASVPEALRGYKEIHLRALKLLKPGGTLATFCCSHHVDALTFQQVVLEAAFGEVFFTARDPVP